MMNIANVRQLQPFQGDLPIRQLRPNFTGEGARSIQPTTSLPISTNVVPFSGLQLVDALKAKSNITFKGNEHNFDRPVHILSGAEDSYFQAMQRGPFSSVIIEETDSGQSFAMDLHSKLLSQGFVLIQDPVTPYLATRVGQELLYLVAKRVEDNDNSPIIMLVNSPGGSVYDGLSITDYMDLVKNTEVNGEKLQIVAVISGMAASMGSVIAANANKCYMTPNSEFMLHEASWGIHGKSSDHAASLRETAKLEEKLFRIYEKKTGYTPKEFKEWLKRKDIWLTPEQSIKLGLADGIARSLNFKEEIKALLSEESETAPRERVPLTEIRDLDSEGDYPSL